jgi:hypothetical protein
MSSKTLIAPYGIQQEPDDSNRILAASQQQEDTRWLPARLYLFVLADEIVPSGKVVRRVMVLNDYNAELVRSAPEIAERLMWPEKFGMRAPNPGSPISMGWHVKGMNDSRFLSASRLPSGPPRIDGRPVWIDINRAQKAGVTIHDTDEIVRDIDRIVAKTRKPQTVREFTEIKKLVAADKEVLLEGEVPASAIKSAASMGLTRGLRVVQGVGIILSVYDLEQAGVRSFRQQSVQPIAREAVRQVGGWGGAFVGVKLGAATGAVIGIESGPGAVITAAVGGIAGGILGFLGSDWLAKKFF